MSVIPVHSNVRDYTVHFHDNVQFINSFSRFAKRLFVIDAEVWRLHSEGCLAGIPQEELMLFAVSEERKTLDGVMEIYDRLMASSAKKNMTLISIGGGIVQDVTGFVTSTLYRGLNWIFVPTTLLAQSDSCIGSKTSLNYKRYKNLIGTFYPPAEVHISTAFLQTLREGDFRSGLGEVAKLHLMGGQASAEDFAAALPAILHRDDTALTTAIRSSLAIKLSYMEGDEFDTGRRNLLNYGHCFGHALETVTDYAIPHGQAVVIGMLLANELAVQRGLLAAAAAEQIAGGSLKRILDFRLAQIKPSMPSLIDAMKQDKKRIGNDLVMVMLTDGMELIKADDVTPAEIEHCWQELLRTGTESR